MDNDSGCAELLLLLGNISGFKPLCVCESVKCYLAGVRLTVCDTSLAGVLNCVPAGQRVTGRYFCREFTACDKHTQGDRSLS